jgi:hypothetical protein
MDLQTVIINGVFIVIASIISGGIFSLFAQKKLTAAKVKTEEETTEKTKAETEKLRSEAAQIIQDSSGDLVMEYQKQLKEMKEERIKDKVLFEEERAKDKKRFEEELFNVRTQLTERINKLEDDLVEANMEIDKQNIIIRELTDKIVQLQK